MDFKNMTDAQWEEYCETQARDGGYTVDGPMEYDDFLDVTGLDDSFVGSPEHGTPGTYDLYEAAMRIAEREAQDAPAI